MESVNPLLAHLIVIAVTVATSLLLLSVTRSVVTVALASAVLTSAIYVIFARLHAGYWDKFAFIAFFFIAAYSGAISLGLLWIGRSMRWRYFLASAKSQVIDPDK